MKTDPQLKIRLPSDVKAFLETEARRNSSSQNSEIVRAVRERMDRTSKAAPESVGALAEA